MNSWVKWITSPEGQATGPPKKLPGRGGGGGGGWEPVFSSFAGSPYNTLLIEILCIYLYNKMK